MSRALRAGDRSLPLAVEGIVPSTQPSSTKPKRLGTLPLIEYKTLLVERGGALPAAVPTRAELMPVLAKHYGDVLRHPNVRLWFGTIDMSQVPGVRYSETDRLERLLMSPPYAFDIPYHHGPTATAERTNDAGLAMQEQAAYARFMLSQGVALDFVVHPRRASEAAFATDGITRIGPFAVKSNPMWAARRLERQAYVGCVNLASYGATAPVEFGDVQLAFNDGKLYVIQGVNSQRSGWNSIEAVRKLLGDKRRDLGAAPIHLPVEIRQFDIPDAKPGRWLSRGVLHLDFVMNQMGGGDTKPILIVCPDGLADPQWTISQMQRARGVADENVLIVEPEEVLAGLTNFVSLRPNAIVTHIDSRITEEARRRGIEVTIVPAPEHVKKDGVWRCGSGQVGRARPF